MKSKLAQSIPTLLALAAIGFSYFSLWCTRDGQVCSRTLLDQMFPYITTPLYLFALYILPVTVVLIFIPRHVFNSWLKFAVWAVPLLLIFIATQPVVSGMFSTDRNDAARLAGEVFAAVSLVLIAWKWFTSRRQN